MADLVVQEDIQTVIPMVNEKDSPEGTNKGTGRDIPVATQKDSVPVAVSVTAERAEADKADALTWNQKKWGKTSKRK